MARKRLRTSQKVSAKETQHKKSRDLFKLELPKVKVTTDTPDFKNVNVELSWIYEYSYENGLKCKVCAGSSSFKTIQVMSMQLESDGQHGNWITVNDNY